MPARVMSRRGAPAPESRAGGGVRRSGATPVPAVGGGDRAGVGQREQIVEIQRSRLLAAAVVTVDELGYVDTTVADVTSRARVSRRTFYELFENREACLLALLEDVVGRIARELAAAELGDLGWCERVRGALWAILSFFDREPVLARVCVVHALRGGPEVLECREEILARLAGVIDEGRLESARGEECTVLMAEGLVGGGVRDRPRASVA